MQQWIVNGLFLFGGVILAISLFLMVAPQPVEETVVQECVIVGCEGQVVHCGLVAGGDYDERKIEEDRSGTHDGNGDASGARGTVSHGVQQACRQQQQCLQFAQCQIVAGECQFVETSQFTQCAIERRNEELR